MERLPVEISFLQGFFVLQSESDASDILRSIITNTENSLLFTLWFNKSPGRLKKSQE